MKAYNLTVLGKLGSQTVKLFLAFQSEGRFFIGRRLLTFNDFCRSMPD